MRCELFIRFKQTFWKAYFCQVSELLPLDVVVCSKNIPIVFLRGLPGFTDVRVGKSLDSGVIPMSWQTQLYMDHIF